MKRKTLYAYQEVDVEYDVEFDDLLEMIGSCDEDELNQIRGMVSYIKCDNLYDEQKMKMLISAFHKYELDELTLRLK